MRTAWWWGAVAALVLGGCVPSSQVLRLQSRTQVAVAFVADSASGEVKVAPKGLRAQVAHALGQRNLEVQEFPFERFAEPFSKVRDTARRLELLAERTEAPLLLLVEAKATFFSQISGRYRWVVAGKVAAQAKDGGAPVIRELELPVLLVFDHEREPEAFDEAAPAIADHAGAAFDELLALWKDAGAQAARPQAPRDLLYFVMVDRFANGDPANDGAIDPDDPQAFHGGDLAGLLERLDYLQELGVGAVWLSPVFKMRTQKFFGHGAFHGYWVEDPWELEPRMGDLALLKKLSDELHRRQMKLVLDIVLNHVGPDAPLVKERPHWFHRKGPLEDWSDPVQLVEHDVHGLPDLAVEREEVYQFLLGASKKWIDAVRPDGFRLDAVKHLPLSFWRRFNADIRRHAGPDFLLLGEMLDGDPAVLARTQREGAFGALFDFPLHFATQDVFCKDQSAARLGAVLSSDRLYPDAHTLVTLVDNHDLPRLASVCQGDLQRIQGALLFTFTARGRPSLTYGTEVGLTGESEPENRADMRFETHPLRDYIAKLSQLRGRHLALRDGVPLLLHAAQDSFAYARVSAEEVALVAVNWGRGPLKLEVGGEVGGSGWLDGWTGAAVPAGEASIGPRTVRLLVSEAAEGAGLGRVAGKGGFAAGGVSCRGGAGAAAGRAARGGLGPRAWELEPQGRGGSQGERGAALDGAARRLHL
jgi:glycosidase